MAARIELGFNGSHTEPIGIHLDESTLWTAISNLPIGPYQVCAALRPKAETNFEVYGEAGIFSDSSTEYKGFNATGIAFNLQIDVRAMMVNYLNPKLGVRVNLPRAIGNRVVLSGNRSFEGFMLSLIRPEGDCNDLNDNPPTCESIGNTALVPGFYLKSQLLMYILLNMPGSLTFEKSCSCMWNQSNPGIGVYSIIPQRFCH